MKPEAITQIFLWAAVAGIALSILSAAIENVGLFVLSSAVFLVSGPLAALAYMLAGGQGDKALWSVFVWCVGSAVLRAFGREIKRVEGQLDDGNSIPFRPGTGPGL